MNNYIIRKANKKNDDKQLNTSLTDIFHPEEVGILAEVLFNHFPGMKKDYWYIAEDPSSSRIVASFTLIPWIWEMKGIRLKAAEMGLVGTLKEHRGRGLMKLLNNEFDKTLVEEQFDIAVIEGIPGFYHKFGYHYAVALENSINIPFRHVEKWHDNTSDYSFWLATPEDIPFLMKEDEKYRSSYLLSTLRQEAQWSYLLGHSRETDCAAEFWIMEHKTKHEKFYFKIPLKGFGKGLIFSEASEDISTEATHGALHFCRQKAIERGKPYIRMNLHTHSAMAEKVIQSGIEESKTYAWQIKIPDKIRFLIKMTPLFEERISQSDWANFSGVFRMNFYSETIDLNWLNGKLKSVTKGSDEECMHTFCLGSDLFPALALGHRSWEELQYIRPDTSPEFLYILPTEASLTDKTGSLVNTLFPAQKSWIYLQY